VPATVGFRFTQGGHHYEVVGLDGVGVKAAVCGGRATTTLKFGSIVNSLGATVVVGHPACRQAAERLKLWRGERARSSRKPAYTVFDDRTLKALAAVLPTDEFALAAIPGIGPVKLEAYGPELTAMFEELRSEQTQLATGPTAGAEPRVSPSQP
jgi:superfamily II DNA helicase RecQ